MPPYTLNSSQIIHNTLSVIKKLKQLEISVQVDKSHVW